jgi:hypothetical protein
MFDTGVELGSKTALDFHPHYKRVASRSKYMNLLNHIITKKLVCVSNDVSNFFSFLPKKYFFPKTRIPFHSKFILIAK